MFVGLDRPAAQFGAEPVHRRTGTLPHQFTLEIDEKRRIEMNHNFTTRTGFRFCLRP